jgi:sugar phosphate isomerase/epimerase
MKFSIVLSTQSSSFSALAYKGNLARNIAEIKALGYDGVELAVRDPGLIDIDALTSTLREHHLPVPALGTGQAYGEEKLSFTDPNEAIRGQAIARIKAHVILAGKLNAMVIIGLIRGKAEREVTVDRAENWLCDALRECASFDTGVRFAIEPINRYETNLVNTVGAGLKLLDRVGRNNVGLLLDTFHMNIEEASMTESIRAAGERLFHFHVADSNRWYPGAGHIDFRTILGVLSEIRYDGFVSAEILPLPHSDLAAKRSIEYLRALDQKGLS